MEEAISETTLSEEAESLLALCSEQEWQVATAESLTGGLIVATLTAIDGCSHLVDRGFVTYSNQAKIEMLGVPPEMIAAHGAVSDKVAAAMATGALARSTANVALACTGLAGPDSEEGKPVGLVYIACAHAGAETVVQRHMFSGDRRRVRNATVHAAFRLLRDAAG
jgi:nicotinamide-nucleotide amidase